MQKVKGGSRSVTVFCEDPPSCTTWTDAAPTATVLHCHRFNARHLYGWLLPTLGTVGYTARARPSTFVLSVQFNCQNNQMQIRQSCKKEVPCDLLLARAAR